MILSWSGTGFVTVTETVMMGAMRRTVKRSGILRRSSK